MFLMSVGRMKLLTINTISSLNSRVIRTLRINLFFARAFYSIALSALRRFGLLVCDTQTAQPHVLCSIIVCIQKV